MTLVEDGTLRLDDPVDDLLPELADMTVLADPDGSARRHRRRRTGPITLRDLLTFTLGTGMVPAEPGTVPIADALDADSSRNRRRTSGSARLGALPLVHQPGERWMYETAADVTGVLIARATGQSFGEALQERICEPLGHEGHRASASAATSLDRFATAYERDKAAGAPWSRTARTGGGAGRRRSSAGGGGLVSTADDYLAFASALLAGGTLRGERVLSRPAVTLMTSDQLTPAQKAVSGFWPGLLRRHRLGLRDVGPHPAHAPRPVGRQLRLARLLRHRLVQRPGRGPDGDLHHAAGPRRRPDAADVARPLDRRSTRPSTTESA